MAGMRQNLQGRPIYGGNSFAPTRGPVSAAGSQGYLQREMRNRNQGNRGMFGGVSKFGRDGQSDTRSGMAAAALGRRAGNKWAGQEGRPGFNPAGPRGGGKKPAGGMGGAWGGQQWQNNYPQGGGGGGAISPPAGGGAAPAAAGNPAAPAPSAPQAVTINDQGRLELPYSEQWSSDLLASYGQYNQDLADIQAEEQQQALQYAADKRNAAEGYEVQKRGTESGVSARGTLFSSAHAGAIGNNARNYNNMVSDIETGNTNAMTDYANRRTGIITDFQSQMQQDALAYAAEVDDDAGSLGYGQDRQNVLPHRNKKKPPVNPDNKRHPKGSGWGPAHSGNWSNGAGNNIKKGKKK